MLSFYGYRKHKLVLAVINTYVQVFLLVEADCEDGTSNLLFEPTKTVNYVPLSAHSFNKSTMKAKMRGMMWEVKNRLK